MSPTLSDRQVQVLDGISHGMSNGEIGRQLFLSEDTVKTHVRLLMKKLRAQNRTQCVRIGFEQGLLRLHSRPTVRLLAEPGMVERVDLMRVLDPHLGSHGMAEWERKDRASRARCYADRILAAGYRRAAS